MPDSRREPEPDLDSITAEIRRLEGQLAAERATVESLEQHRRVAIELEIRLDDLRASQAAAEATADERLPDVEATIMRAAAITGEITTSALRALPGLDVPMHTLERAIKRLVAAGRLAETDDTGRSALGRGRAPRIYRLAGDVSDTGRTAPVIEGDSARIKSKQRAR